MYIVNYNIVRNTAEIWVKIEITLNLFYTIQQKP